MNIQSVASLGECRYPSPLAQAEHEDVFIPANIKSPRGGMPADVIWFELAGPQKQLYFDPKNTRAAIVTCGGLCPGLNNVIRSLFRELTRSYGVQSVFGIRGGYGGLDPSRGEPPILLTNDFVEDIHKDGGTVLGTSRGPVDTGVAVDFLIQQRIDMLFCIGGDGTQRGGRDLCQEAQRRGYSLAVVGIPKTIDNDVPFVSRTFGFNTAVEESCRVIDSAHTEARSVHNGIGLVKLMGRHAGFIAAAATGASQDVNFCLVPEVPFRLEGEHGFLAALERRLEARRHAVIVVAEGAGQDLLGKSNERDVSGNLKLNDIGSYLRDEITRYFTEKKIEVIMRYLEPSYQIRGRPANTDDAVLCDRFSRHAVHAAMAGKTGVVISYLNGQFVYVPTELVTATRKRIDPEEELWRSVLSATGQRARFE